MIDIVRKAYHGYLIEWLAKVELLAPHCHIFKATGGYDDFTMETPVKRIYHIFGRLVCIAGRAFELQYFTNAR